MDLRELIALVQAGQQVPHADLYNARATAPPDFQAILGPMEHQAFAREWTQDNPWLAVPSLTAAIPAYTLAKMAGVLSTRSPASLQEMLGGYKGMFEGLRR